MSAFAQLHHKFFILFVSYHARPSTDAHTFSAYAKARMVYNQLVHLVKDAPIDSVISEDTYTLCNNVLFELHVCLRKTTPNK